MYSLDFGNTAFDTAILIKLSALETHPLNTHYIEPLKERGANTSGMMAVSLEYDGKKPSAKCRKAYLHTLLPKLGNSGVRYLLCADGEYFKTLTGATSVEKYVGYLQPCVLPGHETMSVVYVPNYQSFFYDQNASKKRDLSIEALAHALKGSFSSLGCNVLREYREVYTAAQLRGELQRLMDKPMIAADIEAFSLKHYSAGLGTIAFAWSEHAAFAAAIDYHGEPESRAVLKEFFKNYRGIILWHNAAYDCYVLTYQLFMEHLLDKKGMLEGIEVMLRGAIDTQLVVYLATNNCVENVLGLKENAYEFLGNYEENVKDIRQIPIKDLLTYNAKDTCGTFYVYNKYWPIVVQDQQEEFYEEIFRPALHDIIEMQLVGMCLDPKQVLVAEGELVAVQERAMIDFQSHPAIARFELRKRIEEMRTRNAAYKKKVITLADTTFSINLNSHPQMSDLLYTELGLPVLERTKTKQPSVSGKIINKLLKHTDDESTLRLLKAMDDYLTANKILTTFISTFKEKAIECPDGSTRIFGSYKLGGTVSARLTSSSPNLQQIPSGSKYGKLIKSCFIAPPGYVFAMSDFSALEDVVNTLLTKDPAKRKILTEGFDGHMYRAMHFWAEKFPNVDLDDPDDVNRYCDMEWASKIRGNGKPVHFSQQYLGTWNTLVKNCGFEPEEAQLIEQRYQNLYRVSFDWVAAKIQEASNQGYSVAAFGLRIRTPLLKQVVLGNRSTPKEAEAESRTLGNAVSGQSYCLLNGRASAEFMQRVRASKYRYDIHLCSQIHDAIYVYVRDDLEAIAWVNDNLLECMRWQELPELQDPAIKLSSDLDIAYPTWKDTFTLPHGISAKEIADVMRQERDKRMGKVKEANLEEIEKEFEETDEARSYAEGMIDDSDE